MATAKKPAAKKVAVKKVAAKTAAAKKPAVKKPAVKKVAVKKTAAAKPAAKKVARTPNAAFMKALTPSAELAAVIGATPVPRTEVTKKIWDYIKKHDLQDPKNRRNINADAKLKPLFGKAQVSMFELTKIVSSQGKLPPNWDKEIKTISEKFIDPRNWN